MERGPMALFGAIVAVGLGPALWLGAQFGSATVLPPAPPAVVEANQDAKAPGGAGAAPDDEAVEPTRNSRFKETSGDRKKPAADRPEQPVESPDPDPSIAPEPSDDPTTPPTETTTEPVDEEPTGGTGGTTDPVPPVPPGPDLPDEPAESQTL